MTLKHLKHKSNSSLTYTLIATYVLCSGNVFAEHNNHAESSKNPHAAAHWNQASQVSKEKQSQLVKEGVEAVMTTEKALSDLEQNNSKDALVKLNDVSAKLQTLLSKGNAAQMVPVSFQEQSYVFEGSLDDVKEQAQRASELIDDHRIQEARYILDGLTSEIRINVIELPLSEYPAAIDKAKSLISSNKIGDAKKTLADILDRLVAHIEIYPLPILAAEADLSDAFELEHKTDWTKPEQKDAILTLVDKTEEQIKLAEALGYGDKKDFETLTESIQALRETLHTDKFKAAWDKAKAGISQLKSRFVHPSH